MRIDKIPTGVNPPDNLNVIIEVPTGGEPVKYEFDKESGALFVAEVSFQLDHALEAVMRTILANRAPDVAQTDLDMFHRPLMPGRIHAERHGRTGAKGREKDLIGIGAGVPAADGLTLIGAKNMMSRSNELAIRPIAAFGNRHNALVHRHHRHKSFTDRRPTSDADLF